MGLHVLVIEDDEKLGSQFVGQLRGAGYEVTWFREGRLLSRDVAEQYDLLVLDLMLPGQYGMDILKNLRTHSDLPVLVLSARVDATDKVRALRLGADDYLTKPFWPDELLERVKARLRRPILQRDGRVELEGLSIDFIGREVKIEGHVVELTRLEFDLLAALAKRPGEAITRQWLMSNVLDPDRESGERTLDVHVSRLRKKLGDGDWVQTVWGIGYRLGVSK
jgi:two-component system response regulator MtrA